MDQQLHANEERLFDLLENKNFEQLTAEERAFAETQLSEREYRLQRRTITGAARAFPENRPARPLVLPRPKGVTIPLWQAAAAVAATVAVFLLLWPRQHATKTGESQEGQLLSRTDTVIETKYITDTVVRYVKIRDSRKQQRQPASGEGISVASPRTLDAPHTVEIPDLKRELSRTRGTSKRQDEANGLSFKGMYQAMEN